MYISFNLSEKISMNDIILLGNVIENKKSYRAGVFDIPQKS